METPWIDRVKAALYMGLPGQAGGEAAAALLTGTTNPGGKLTETWPLSYDQVPSRDTFGQKVTRYKKVCMSVTATTTRPGCRYGTPLAMD